MKMSSFIPQANFIRRADNISSYDKVYFFTEQDTINIPDNIIGNSKVEIFGKNFKDLPLEVEHHLPNIKLYQEFINEKLANEIIKPTTAISFLDSNYFCAKDQKGNWLPLPPGVFKRKIYMYDNDFLSYSDCFEILNKISKEKPSSIQFVKPLKCKTLLQFFKLREGYELLSRQNTFILDFFVPYNDFDRLFSKYTLKLLCEISKNSNIKIYIGKNYLDNVYNENFYIDNLYHTLHYLFSFLSRRIPIKICQYDYSYENSFLSIYQPIISWTNQSDNLNKTLEKSLRTKKQKELLQTLIEKKHDFINFFKTTKQQLYDLPGGWRI